MSRVPGIHEIFSSKAMGKNGAFQFENQESKQQLKLSNNESEAASPMKKFGAYKPKILAGETDFIEIQENSSPDTSLPTLAPPALEQFQDTPGLKTQPVNSVPWVIGDKNVPMVLGSTTDDDDFDNINQDISNWSTDAHDVDNDHYNTATSDTNSSHRTFSVSSDTSTLLRQTSDNSRQGLDNPGLYSNGFALADDPESTAVVLDTYIRDSKTNGINPDDMIGVFIPPPDYDEEEKTLDFNSEDTDDPSDGGEEIKPRQSKPKTAVKVYEGADLSHFLAEDEVEQKVVYRNAPGRKSDSQGPKIQEKQSLFKQLSSNKSKRKNSGNAPKFNSVRSFSYADSKFGTKGKAIGKSFSASNLGDDSDRFLSANTQESSYESFLRSRNGDDLPFDSMNAGGDNGEVGTDSALKHKGDPVWKKLTLRLKQKVNKTVGTKEP